MMEEVEGETGDWADESSDLFTASSSGPLGAHYNAAQTQVDFRVYSSRATRIELYVYAQAFGADEVASYVMTKDATTKIWSKSVSTAELANLGISGHVYYGYRAWGPNWPYSAG